MPDPNAEVIQFGHFTVLAHRRELLEDGRPLALGGRAFDLLLALIEGRGRVLTTDELMERVWPGRVVEENSLHSHVSALRRALASDKSLIRTVPGRGYQFTGECTTGGGREPPLPAGRSGTNLPERVSELFGRDADLYEVAELARTQRLVTLVGVGGIGKTRLAMDVARSLLPRFSGGAWLAELAPLADPELVGARLAAALGAGSISGPATPERIAATIGGRHLLLVLDNCEHVIDAAARFAEAVLLGCPEATVVATSREPLLVEGEHVYRVPPLDVPGDVSDEEALQSGALRLFMARVRASRPSFVPDAAFVRVAAAVCRRLDGLPLAIELAAARSEALGIDTVADRLDDRFTLLAGGRRTALPRHQTLRATFDWSHELLTAEEQQVLRRLAVFAGPFSLEMAAAVVGDGPQHKGWIANDVASLVSKSLVVAEHDTGPSGSLRYRLLETVRAYAAEKLAEAGETDMLSRRHAVAHLAAMEVIDTGASLPSLAWLEAQAASIDNLRAALDWSFADGGDVAIGERLTIAAVPLWMHLSLVDECRRRAQRVFPGAAEPPAVAARAPEQAMRLHAAQGAALLYTSMGPEARAAWEQTLTLAEGLGNVDYQLRSLWGLWVDRLNGGRFREALAIAERYLQQATLSRDANELAIGHRLVGVSMHFLGDLLPAEEHLQRMLDRYVPPADHLDVLRFQFDPSLTARCFQARVRWLRGRADEALALVEQVVAEAGTQGHALTLINSLGQGACLVALYSGAHAAARRYGELLLEQSSRHDIALWHAWALCFLGAVAAREGDALAGVLQFRAALTDRPETLRLPRYLALLGELSQALLLRGRIDEAERTIDEAIARARAHEERWYLPELLRLKGEAVRGALGRDGVQPARQLFNDSLELARGQGALSWQLRSAASWVRSELDGGNPAAAFAVLRNVTAELPEANTSLDARSARELLAQAPEHAAPPARKPRPSRSTP